ncbi:hypothetical protein [Macrococcus sp. DPC7161]|uniref:hypothetical protein n=1 Tax=Macrococcus sp. DPC7161 TaxID=2507060 RepID=UPI00100B6CE7|nr:hypothetical protein [Macrococcus sp. DPC7161]RXK19057.1 hypothetical protein ER639_01720 [Macrococcus sp. DPC7161]
MAEKVSYYFSLKNSTLPLFVSQYTPNGALYTTDELKAKQYKGFEKGELQPPLETHNIHKLTETTTYKREKVEGLDNE